MKIDVQIDGEARLMRAFARVESLGKPATFLPQLGGILSEDLREGFDGSRSPEGLPWAALKRRVGKPLLDTGTHLRNPLHWEMDGDDTVVIGVPVWWGVVHQEGSASRNIPARPFLGISPNARGQMLGALREIAA